MLFLISGYHIIKFLLCIEYIILFSPLTVVMNTKGEDVRDYWIRILGEISYSCVIGVDKLLMDGC